MKATKGDTRKVKGFDVILTGETTVGKSGETFHAVQIVSYTFQSIGKPKPRYGKPQWVRESLIQ